jgi:two-component system chemotaxis response regulator CheY
MRILLVEDDPGVLQSLSIVLEHDGHSVATATNGKEALDLVRESAPDLIILDLWMPVMNGWEFLGRLRETEGHVRDVPVIAVSADMHVKRQDLPVESFLPKPLDIDTLLTTVHGMDSLTST